jgi:PAS domain S-box-containing protein
MIFLLTGLFNGNILGQDKDKILDSLESEIQNLSRSEKLDKMIYLAWKNVYDDPAIAEIYATKAIELAKLEKDEEKLAIALNHLGDANYNLFKYHLSLENYSQALKLATHLSNDTLVSDLYFAMGYSKAMMDENEEAMEFFIKSVELEEKIGRKKSLSNRFTQMGHSYYELGDYTNTLENYRKAVLLVEEVNDTSSIANLYNYIGIIYADLGSYEKALEYYIKSLELFRSYNHQEGIGIALNNIGIVYHDWGNNEKALEYYQKSHDIAKSLNDKLGMAGSLNNIGIIYSDWEQNDIAIDYYNKAKIIYEEFENKEGMSQVLNNLGESYFAINEIDKSMDYMARSIEIVKEIKNNYGLAQSYLTMGQIHFKQGKLNMAMSYNNQSFKLADSLKFSSILLENYELFYEILAKRGNFAGAFKYLKDYTKQKDLIYNNRFHKTLAELQAKNEIERNDKENETLINAFKERNKEKEKEVRTQRIYLIIIFILMIVFGILVYYDIRSKIAANKKLKEINSEIFEQKEKLSKTLDELSKSEFKYKNLVEYSPTGILLIDCEGNILEVNRTMLNILGSPGEEETKKINCLNFEPLKAVGLAGDILKAIEKGKLINEENRYVTAWKKEVYLRYYIAPIKNRKDRVTHLIINVEDISTSKKAQAALIHSEQKYRVLVENSLQAMFVIQEGDVVFANSRMEDLTGYTFEEVTKMGKGWLQNIVYPDDQEKLIQNLSNAKAQTGFPLREVYRYISRKEEIGYLETLGSLIVYENKPALLVVAIDITDRKEAEKILIDSERVLREANTMKDKFFSIIAHDLKNPFNAIMGFSNLLYEAYDNFDEKQRKTFIKNICEASESTFKLLQNLLEWSRTQTGNIDFNPQQLDLIGLINENISLLKSSAENKNISVKLGTFQKTSVFADENMVKAILRNLLSNAIKFTDVGGKVSVNVKLNEDMAEVTIEDNGIGIKPEDIVRLFRIDDQFKSDGTAKEQGTGLGLILCKEFVEKNQGSIWVKSEAEKGSQFSFSLPIKEQK